MNAAGNSEAPFSCFSRLRRQYAAGNQNAFADGDPRIVELGCGLIALSDLLLYLRGIGDSDCISLETVSVRHSEIYVSYVRALNRRAAVRALIGLNGLSMARAFNRYAKRRGWRYRACWGQISGTQLSEKVRCMLAADIPVIFSVGPGFFGERGVQGIKLLEVQRKNGNLNQELMCVGTVRNHYMTIVGMVRFCGRDYFRVVSWGRVYLISEEEYLRGRQKLPFFGRLFSSILEVRQ